MILDVGSIGEIDDQVEPLDAANVDGNGDWFGQAAYGRAHVLLGPVHKNTKSHAPHSVGDVVNGDLGLKGLGAGGGERS